MCPDKEQELLCCLFVFFPDGSWRMWDTFIDQMPYDRLDTGTIN